VSTERVRGVIFDATCTQDVADYLRARTGGGTSGYFAPSVEQVRAFELRLRPALERGRAEPETLLPMPADREQRADMRWGVRSALDEILAQYARYRRQYAGVVLASGAWRVLASSFPEARVGERDEFPDWTTRWLGDAVDDGGADYWRIQYDLVSGRFSAFDVNGSA
jgi:hypothetical protein